jgi:bacterioferritin
MEENPFKTDIETIKKRARADMEDGAITKARRQNAGRVVKVLQSVLATEIVCTLRYRNNHYVAEGLGATDIAEEFAEHADEEQGHLEMVAERIDRLGGVPDYNPRTLMERSHADYVQKETLEELVRENLVAERVAVDSYTQIVQWLGNDDPITKRMMEKILAQEEEHADELVNLLERVRRFTDEPTR